MLDSLRHRYWRISQKPNPTVLERALVTSVRSGKAALRICGTNKLVSGMLLRTKAGARRLLGRDYRFVSARDAFDLAGDLIKKFSSTDIDIVIGAPRSGLFVANIIALRLGKTLSTPELFVRGEVWRSCRMPPKTDYRNVLLVEDVVCKGVELAKSLEILEQSPNPIQIRTAALLVVPASRHLVDHFARETTNFTTCEWAFLHVKIPQTVAFDLDGVLCQNPAAGVDDDEELYCRWIENAVAYLIPTYEIDYIVTARLESYRRLTETWLARHKVRYKQLIMWDLPSKADRQDGFARFKIDQLTRLRPDFFVESEDYLARDVWQATRIPTLCTEAMLFHG